MSELQQGEIAECEDCPRARPIKTPVVRVFGDRVGFGPRGPSDMFIESDGVVRCHRCADADDISLDKGANQQ